MPVGLAPAVANALLDALGNATNYTAPTAFWLRLHIGDPGAAGTANGAAHTTRQQVSFGAAASGLMSNDAAVEWTNVSAAEDYTHWSAWTASTAGSFIMSGTITANAVLVGDTFRIPVGDIDITMSVAS